MLLQLIFNSIAESHGPGCLNCNWYSMAGGEVSRGIERSLCILHLKVDMMALRHVLCITFTGLVPFILASLWYSVVGSRVEWILGYGGSVSVISRRTENKAESRVK